MSELVSHPQEDEKVPCRQMVGEELTTYEDHHFTIMLSNGPGVPWWKCTRCSHIVMSN